MARKAVSAGSHDLLRERIAGTAAVDRQAVATRQYRADRIVAEPDRHLSAARQSGPVDRQVVPAVRLSAPAGHQSVLSSLLYRRVTGTAVPVFVAGSRKQPVLFAVLGQNSAGLTGQVLWPVHPEGFLPTGPIQFQSGYRQMHPPLPPVRQVGSVPALLLHSVFVT